MNMKQYLQEPELVISSVAAIFAFGAAIFWFFSARVKIPSKVHISIFVEKRPMALLPLGVAAIGVGHSKDLDEITSSLAKQGKWSRYAAGCASLAALFQGLAVFVSTN
ncbi:MAG: hypothetical protein ACTSY1_07375 [Alphaproteobacteria bacterium]